MTKILAIVLIIGFACNSKNEKADNFIFEDLFYKSSIVLKLKLIAKENNKDRFLFNIKNCKPLFYNGVKKYCTFYLRTNNQDYDDIVVEYIFENNKSAKLAFSEVNEYAEATRKMERAKFGERCFEGHDYQIYYAIIKNNHIFLFTTFFNFQYEGEVNSVDKILNVNKEILFDDLYMQLNNQN